VAGRRLLDGDLLVVQLADPAEVERRTTWYVGLGVAWSAYAGCLLAGGWLAFVRRPGAWRIGRKGGALESR
jgi:hypothetical protein